MTILEIIDSFSIPGGVALHKDGNRFGWYECVAVCWRMGAVAVRVVVSWHVGRIEPLALAVEAWVASLSLATLINWRCSNLEVASLRASSGYCNTL